MVSYETFKHVTPVKDTAGTSNVPAFTMNRARAGIFFDLKPMLDWPVRFQGGYTMDESKNGAQNLLGKDYGLTSAMIEGGAEWDFIEEMGLSFGYRHMNVAGFNERFNFSVYPNGIAFDAMAGSLWWHPMKDVRFDAVYTQIIMTAPGVTNVNFEVDQGVIRMTIQF